jgi:hypothetical protein
VPYSTLAPLTSIPAKTAATKISETKEKGADTKLINHTTDQDNSTKPAKAWYFRLPMA